MNERVTLTPAEADFLADCLEVGSEDAESEASNITAAQEFAASLRGRTLGTTITITIATTNEEEE